MVSEELFVSVEQIRVSYVFRNRAAQDRTVIVAFPMPDRDLSLMRNADIGYPSDFHAEIAGRPVAMALDRHAVLGGRDHTALLRGLNVPLAPDAEGTIRIVEALGRLPAARRAELLRLGLIEPDPFDESRLVPMWTLRDTWHWQQTFPAGRDLAVAHRYRPGAGSAPGLLLADRAYRGTAEARAEFGRYCPDAAFLAGVDRFSRASGGTEMDIQWLGYILTTGGNWRSPIGSFRLVVDKGDARSLVSFCGEGVRRISPTQFEMRRTNWRPDRDLAVLIVHPPS
jgi:hypothetical protein